MLGLTVGQAMGVIVGASILAGLLAVIAGWMGSHHYVGFTVLSRGYVCQMCLKCFELADCTYIKVLGNERWLLASA